MSSSQRKDFDTTSQRVRSYLDERIQEISRGLSEILVEPPPQGTPADHGPLARFTRFAERCTEQVAILERLLEEASRAGSRAILFVVKGSVLRGWAARGMPGPFQPKSLSLPVTPDDLLGRAVENAAPVVEAPGDRPGNGVVAATLGSGQPASMLAAPLWVRDKVVALLYVDAEEGAAWQPDAASLMASIAALSLEALPYRARFRRPEPAVETEEVEEPGSLGEDHTAVAPGTAPDVEHATEAGPAATTPEEPPPAAAATMSVGGSEPPSIEPDPEEQRLHDEARRFAALLASEIVLYNEKQLEEGRRNKDLYERLKDDIDRSYRMFEQRVSSKLSGATRYFKEEIVRALANGDESAIRLPWD